MRLYILKKKRKVYIHTQNKIYESNMTLDDIWSQLDKKLFCSIHISYIVNLDYIKEIIKNEVKLKTGEIVHISRTYHKNIKSKYLDFLKYKY